jgi:hypothetical protein
MTAELDLDAMAKVDVNQDALDCAIEAATQAFVAGGEEAEQLEAGIRAYIVRLQQLGLKP